MSALTISKSLWPFLDYPRINETRSDLRKALGRLPWEYGLCLTIISLALVAYEMINSQLGT